MGLDTEYRPTTFKDYVIDMDTMTKIRSAINSKDKPRVIFISGPSGLGKTTLARLIAKEYRCENWEENHSACGQCTTCKQFDEYITTGDSQGVNNLNEIDSGRTGSATQVREVIDNIYNTANYITLDSTLVTILDEVHTLSNAAQSALLKFLEEPPVGTLTIMCTTDANRVLNTVKNRAGLTVTLTRPKADAVISRLVSICKYEDIDYDMQGLEIIVARNDNTIRNSIIALDQINTAKGNAKHDSVESYLDADNLTNDVFFNYYSSVLDSGSKAKLLVIINRAVENSELELFADRLVSFTKRGIYIYNGIDIPGISKPEMKRYKALFAKFSIEQISMLLKALKDVKHGDIEANLLSLGYGGLKVNAPIEATTQTPLDTKHEISDEQLQRDAMLKQSRKENEEKALDNIKEINKAMDPKELLSEFNLGS